MHSGWIPRMTQNDLSYLFLDVLSYSLSYLFIQTSQNHGVHRSKELEWCGKNMGKSEIVELSNSNWEPLYLEEGIGVANELHVE